jgi:hypothetical protein
MYSILVLPGLNARPSCRQRDRIRETRRRFFSDTSQRRHILNCGIDLFVVDDVWIKNLIFDYYRNRTSTRPPE